MFDKDRFIESCKAAVPEGQKAMREVVAAAVCDPASIIKSLGEPQSAGLTPLYRSSDLTILQFVWSPRMSIFPHNHEMYSIVGLYVGREDNLFWRRHGAGIEAAGAKSLGPGEVATLGPDIIHSVTNPIGKRSCALHVYGGDFFDPPQPRKEWDHETLEEKPWSLDHAKALFREADARHALAEGI
ncbi:hypothetical protein [Limibacillus sp. MBR-115]|uniref:hypothetical protein n=1 Tax=Limibacillus sp. MBR-115 TaxID=3156465 RepID=UPI003395E7B9